MTNLLFLILIALQFLPNKIQKDTQTAYVIWFAVGVELLVLLVSAVIKKPEGLNLFLDIIGFLFGFLILWTLTTAKFNWLKESLFPPPGRVFAQFIGDWDKILINIKALSASFFKILLATVVSIRWDFFSDGASESALPPPIYQNF